MKTFNFIVLVAVVVFTSCSKNDDTFNEEDFPTPNIQENFNFYKSLKLYTEAQEQRSETYSGAFEIEKVERKGNNLDVTVSYPENCETNKFDVIWNGIVLESWPVQTQIIIKRSASNCNSNEKMKTETLSIDLLKLIGDKVLVEGAVFHVSNASKTSNEEDADTSITHTNN